MTDDPWASDATIHFHERTTELKRRVAQILVAGVVAGAISATAASMSWFSGHHSIRSAATTWLNDLPVTIVPGLAISGGVLAALLGTRERSRDLRDPDPAVRGRALADILWNTHIATAIAYVVTIVACITAAAAMVRHQGVIMAEMLALAVTFTCVVVPLSEIPAAASAAIATRVRNERLANIHQLLDRWPRPRVSLMRVLGSATRAGAFLAFASSGAGLLGTVCSATPALGHQLVGCTLATLVVVFVGSLVKIGVIWLVGPDMRRDRSTRVVAQFLGMILAAVCIQAAVVVLRSTGTALQRYLGAFDLLIFGALTMSGCVRRSELRLTAGPSSLGLALEQRRLRHEIEQLCRPPRVGVVEHN